MQCLIFVGPAQAAYRPAVLWVAYRERHAMTIEALQPFIGRWELSVDIPGAEHVRGSVVFEWLSGGPVLVQQSTVPGPNAPDSICLPCHGPTAATYSITSTLAASRGCTR
jgi:hypothetical protein